MKNMYPTPKMTTRKRSENGRARRLTSWSSSSTMRPGAARAAWRLSMGEWTGGLRRATTARGYSSRGLARRPWRPGSGPHHSVGAAPCELGTGPRRSPRWAKARGVAIRPRGVRWRRPWLEEVGLVGVLDGVGLLPHAVGQGHEPDRAAVEATAQGVEDGPVHLVETELVHPEELEALDGERRRDRALGPHLHEVAHPAQEPVGDPGRAPGPRGDLAGALERPPRRRGSPPSASRCPRGPRPRRGRRARRSRTGRAAGS